MSSFNLGQASIQPNLPVVSGSYTTIIYTYTCGHPIDDSGFLKITFRSVSDVGTPQFHEPASLNYCSVTTTGDCQIEPRWDPKGHIRPWSRALFLKIRDGFLNQGEKITLIFGDTSGGSPGWQMQTNVIEDFEFKTFVDPIATYLFKEIPASPTLKIIPGESVRAICIAPSQVKVDHPFDYHIKLEDRWGNPSQSPVRISHPGFNEESIQTIQVRDPQTGLKAISNPIRVVAGDLDTKHFWADFHGQTGETVGEGTINRFFTFARDYGLLDIAAHSGNDFQVRDDFWTKINKTTRQYYQPGTFVTFPGYEWSGNTALGGDRNVYFEGEGGRITRSSTELLPGNFSRYPDSSTADDLFNNLSRQTAPRSFTFAHVGGRYADLARHDPEIELAIEIHSAWGTFEWLLEEALIRGYRIGICANSDGHKCRPGASYPGAQSFGSYGGLTCVLAPTLDRPSIVNALRNRHCYATTGNRPLIDFHLEINDSTYGMGDIVDINGGTPCLRGQVVGTAPIDYIEIRNGLQALEQIRPFGQDDLGCRVKILWSGARVRGRDRLVHWDGTLSLKDNAITKAEPINFWNANHPLQRIDNQNLAWRSVTTGGVTGIILTLEHEQSGVFHIDTVQGVIEMEIASLGLEPKVWKFGGLEKEIKAYRLPDQSAPRTMSFRLPLHDLHKGDNPILLHLVQQDGHMAWTSPAYLTLP